MGARSGRSSLRIPLDNGLGIGFAGRSSTSAGTATAGPKGNARKPGSSTSAPSNASTAGVSLPRFTLPF